MKNLFALAAFFTLSSAHALDLEIAVEKLRNNDGQILAILFAGEDGFPAEISKAAATAIVDLRTQGSRFVFSGLAPGKYAVALIHDENRDGQLETGTFGIPKEGIGFSNNPRLGMGPPKFEKAAIDVQTSVTSTVRMKYYR